MDPATLTAVVGIVTAVAPLALKIVPQITEGVMHTGESLMDSLLSKFGRSRSPSPKRDVGDLTGPDAALITVSLVGLGLLATGLFVVPRLMQAATSAPGDAINSTGDAIRHQTDAAIADLASIPGKAAKGASDAVGHVVSEAEAAAAKAASDFQAFIGGLF